MEDVVGELLRERPLTIAVYEDITGGMTAERLLQVGPQYLSEGTIGNGEASIARLLARAGESEDRVGILSQDGPSLTDALARAVRAVGKADMGLAVHGVPQDDRARENLGQGTTYIALAGAGTLRNRVYNYAGRGRPDRTRISLNALDLVRRTLMEDM